jgi:hypothetical protein
LVEIGARCASVVGDVAGRQFGSSLSSRRGIQAVAHQRAFINYGWCVARFLRNSPKPLSKNSERVYHATLHASSCRFFLRRNIIESKKSIQFECLLACRSR